MRKLQYIGILLMLIAMSSALSGCFGGAKIERRPYYAIDGDTLSVAPGSPHIRLARIDAPETPGHPCPVGRRPSCIDNDPVWARESKRYLQDILDQRDIWCYDVENDVYGRRIAECYYSDNAHKQNNLSDIMLMSGMAMPYRR